MKKFYLERYLENPKQKIVTRNGNPVRIICTDADSERCVIDLVHLEKEEVVFSHYANGSRWSDSDSNQDLFFATEEEEGGEKTIPSMAAYKNGKKKIIMRQFTLEEYLKNPNQKIVTRTGLPVRIICTDADSDQCVLGLVRLKIGEVVFEYYRDGTHSYKSYSDWDLFFAAEKEECPFKEGDRVLVRDSDSHWMFDKFYSYNEDSDYPYMCIYAPYEQCIPLNEHTWQLLGTTDEYKEE